MGRSAAQPLVPEAEHDRRVTRGGVRLAVREWRSNGPAIVLLHGLASSSRIWDAVVRHLWPAHHVVAYDQRGHGRSDKPAGGYGFDDVCADAGGVIRSLRLERPLVVGHSWGGNVALQLGVEHADRVSGLVLVDGGFMQMSDGMDWATARRNLAPPRSDGMRLDDLLELVRTRTPLGRMWNQDVERTFLSLFEVTDGRVRPRLSRSNHMKILRALWEQPTFDLLRRVEVPTLVIGARPARSFASGSEKGFYEAKKREAKRVRAVGPPVEFEWITSVHDVPLQHPMELAARIAAFATSDSITSRRGAPSRPSERCRSG